MMCAVQAAAPDGEAAARFRRPMHAHHSLCWCRQVLGVVQHSHDLEHLAVHKPRHAMLPAVRVQRDG